jgi:hypothetical protein
MADQTIVDATTPNAGRIYDFLLGGHHNFEIDRQAAGQIEAAFPFLPKAMRLSRWCLQDVARTLTEERGFRTIIDFASGLPTVDHIHTAVAPDTTVIYSDHDPVTVEYGWDILKDVPGTHYFEADARRPEEVLARPEVLKLLGDNRHLAFTYWGVSMYLSDEDIAHVARVLYDESDETSCLAFYIGMADPDSPGTAKMKEMYRQMGETLHFRHLETFQELVKPWRADELGYRSMDQWHGIEVAMSQEDLASFVGGGSGYGVFLVK